MRIAGRGEENRERRPVKLIARRQGRTRKLDLLRCIRRDGSETATAMPRQGILPHDLVHYVAESTLGWRHGFLGMIAAGAHIGWTMAQALALNARWQQVPFHGSLELEMPGV